VCACSRWSARMHPLRVSLVGNLNASRRKVPKMNIEQNLYWQGRVISQAVCRRLPSTETRVRSQGSSCKICCGHTAANYHFTNAPYRRSEGFWKSGSQTCFGRQKKVGHFSWGLIHAVASDPPVVMFWPKYCQAKHKISLMGKHFEFEREIKCYELPVMSTLTLNAGCSFLWPISDSVKLPELKTKTNFRMPNRISVASYILRRHWRPGDRIFRQLQRAHLFWASALCPLETVVPRDSVSPHCG
jgi:hypothetical protein